jgi:phage/plasmid-associated DNA primase
MNIIQSEYLKQCIEFPNHDDLGYLWKEITKHKIICIDVENYVYYRFNSELLLYELISINEFTAIVKNELREYLHNVSTVNTDARLLKLRQSIGNKNMSKQISELLSEKIHDPKFYKKLDVRTDVVNFKNGYVDLTNGKFHKRSETDFYSKCLDYDYSEVQNDKVMKEINNIFKNICNDDDNLLKFNFSWLGYCLTGETREQKSLFVVGHTASNGKSTTSKIFSSAFPCYCYKIAPETFSKNYGKVHKQLANCKGVRYVYLEELDKDSINTSLYKDIVDGDIINNEVLFATLEKITILFKLNCISNHEPNFGTDEGMRRRGLLMTLKNRFLDKDKFQNEKGTYLNNKELIKNFENDDNYKLALFHILLPYAIEFYKNGLYIYSPVREDFNDLCKENDKMQTFIDFTFEITNDDSDKIHKDHFKQLYNDHFKTKMDWIKILSELKRCNLKYERQLRTNYEGQSQKGVILGIRLRNVLDEELKENPLDYQHMEVKKIIVNDDVDDLDELEKDLISLSMSDITVDTIQSVESLEDIKALDNYIKKNKKSKK